MTEFEFGEVLYSTDDGQIIGRYVGLDSDNDGIILISGEVDGVNRVASYEADEVTNIPPCMHKDIDVPKEYRHAAIAHAFQGLLSHYGNTQEKQVIASAAVAYADALIAEIINKKI